MADLAGYPLRPHPLELLPRLYARHAHGYERGRQRDWMSCVEFLRQFRGMSRGPRPSVEQLFPSPQRPPFSQAMTLTLSAVGEWFRGEVRNAIRQLQRSGAATILQGQLLRVQECLRHLPGEVKGQC